MQNIKFPVKFQFKVSTLSNDFNAWDAEGKNIGYVRQKMFKLKEDIIIYADETKAQINYQIKADRWLDFSAAYAFFDAEGKEFGKIARKGWRSMWKAEYEVINQNGQIQFQIKEESAWTRILDNLLGEIPIIGFFTGYLFNPKYQMINIKQNPVMRLVKIPSFLGRKFELHKLGELDNNDDDRVMLAFMMMILLERRRG